MSDPRQHVSHPNVRAFLRAIRLGEGTLPAPRRFGQRSFQWPCAKTVVHRRLCDTESFGPCRGRQCLAPEVNQPRRRSVVVLLLPRRPSAVLGRVSGIVIDPLNRHARRRVAHVVVERARIAPPLAYADPAPAIAVKPQALRVVTTVDHSGPHLIPARAAAGRPAVRRHQCSRAVPAKASAGTNKSRYKVLVRDNLFGAAVARAAPPRFPVARAVEIRRLETAESLPGQIVEVVCAHGYQFLRSESIK